MNKAQLELEISNMQNRLIRAKESLDRAEANVNVIEEHLKWLRSHPNYHDDVYIWNGK